jgi:hypothetical protein
MEGIMSPSLQALVAGLIDYAGLFPPAALPLGEAIRRFLGYLGEEEAWMLCRFVCPASRLPELAREHGDLFARGPRFAISALGRGGANTEEFLTNLEADRTDLDTFTSDLNTADIDVDVLEVRLPADALGEGDRLDRLLAALLDTQRYIFVEAPPERTTLPGVLERLRARVGFKLRCGGTQARAFPSSETVAFALSACVKRGVPFKATAGLHHPLPQVDPVLPARMHGFVNLFAAGVFAQARGVDEKVILSILNDENPGHFVFSIDGLCWGELFVSTQEIALARREAVLAMGSCSFDEPREDLRALGWL